MIQYILSEINNIFFSLVGCGRNAGAGPADFAEQFRLDGGATISFDDSGGTPTYYFNVGDDQNTDSIYLKKSDDGEEYCFTIDIPDQARDRFTLYTSSGFFASVNSVVNDGKLRFGVVRATDKLTIDTAKIEYKDGENSQDLFLVGPESERNSWSNVELPQNYGILKIQINATGERPDDVEINGINETGGDSYISIYEHTSYIFKFTASSNGQLLVADGPDPDFNWGLSDSPDDGTSPRFAITANGELSFVSAPDLDQENRPEYVMSVTAMSLDGETRLANHTIYISVVKLLNEVLGDGSTVLLPYRLMHKQIVDIVDTQGGLKYDFKHTSYDPSYIPTRKFIVEDGMALTIPQEYPMAIVEVRDENGKPYDYGDSPLKLEADDRESVILEGGVAYYYGDVKIETSSTKYFSTASVKSLNQGSMYAQDIFLADQFQGKEGKYPWNPWFARHTEWNQG